MATASRQYDLVLLGATGYTGNLTAEHITKHLPEDLKWAISGRNISKLQALISNLQVLHPDHQPPSIEVTDLSQASIDALVRKTKILPTTVGPYHRYGTPIIEACAHAGTHYLDSTGETPWVYDVAHKYHDLVRSNGAIMIPQCAEESAPADLVAFLRSSFLREKTGHATKEFIHSIQEFNNGFSAGTLHSLITVASSYSFQHLRKSLHPYALCVGRSPSSSPFIPKGFTWLGSIKVKEVGLLTDSVIGISDTTVVYRSWSLMDDYGPRFKYWTGMKARNRVTGFLWHWVLAISLPVLLITPLRSQTKSSTTWKSVAYSDSKPSHTAECSMSFERDMYSLTAILLAEAAMVILRPDRENWAMKLGGGVLTPATLGHQFVERVISAGMKMEINLVDKAPE
ncbi:hypothetical protein P280DRAFT_538326 [Massarina eburnea CBS 473.64]|uniref:Saccharopine dehydrogenase NADP binding domain-containing protein n=1 Tax=Massarina eburnea CBS 473.64 TaxID=1395130 RepID=A0A6A6RHQ7_9PLEO|nr:hypothetical protein P280DRAFT_538326 [Massarina eburnea CBS 473.64]